MLPSDITRIPGTDRLQHADGHVLIPIRKLSDIYLARGLFIRFSTGEYHIYGGMNLLAALHGDWSAGVSTLADLAKYVTQSPFVRAALAVETSGGRRRGHFFDNGFYAPFTRYANTLVPSHLYAVELSPFVSHLMVVGGATRQDANNCCMYQFTTVQPDGSDYTAVPPGPALTAQPSWNGKGHSYNGGRMVLELPLGTTWEQALQAAISSLPDGDRAEVQATFAPKVTALATMSKLARAYPTYFVTFDWMGSYWSYAPPERFTLSDSVGRADTAAWDAPALHTRTGLIVASQHAAYDLASYPVTHQPVKSIDGRHLANFSRGVFHAKVTDATSQLLCVNITSSQLRQDIGGAFAEETQDVPARPEVSGVPVSDQAWADALIAAPAVAQSTINSRIPDGQGYGYSASHAGYLLGLLLHPEKYDTKLMANVEPCQFAFRKHGPALAERFRTAYSGAPVQDMNFAGINNFHIPDSDLTSTIGHNVYEPTISVPVDPA